MSAALARLLCRLLGHDWRTGWEKTHIVTGAGVRHLYCRRCPATCSESIPARGEAR